MTNEPPSQSGPSWFIAPDGSMHSGPFTAEQVRSMLASGMLTPLSLVWRAGMSHWAPLRDTPPFQAAPSPGLPTVVRLEPTTGELSRAPRTTSATVITLIVIGCVLGLCVLLSLLLGLLLPASGRARSTARQIKDSTQVAAIHRGMLLWAQSNGDQYLLPSMLDNEHNTVAQGQPKDTPRHITSVLIYNGYFSPELTVSPAEVNGDIRVCDNYEYSAPSHAAAADKALALWDPAFRALPGDAPSGSSQSTRPQGSFSYAYMVPVGGRKSKWSLNFAASDAIIGNRGPAYLPTGSNQVVNWSLDPNRTIDQTAYATPVGVGSNTLLIHGGRTTWEGNIVYGDHRVNFETRADPVTLPFTFSGLPSGIRSRFDNLFVNENDSSQLPDGDGGTLIIPTHTANTNNYLRNWKDYDPAPSGGFPQTGTINFWFD